MKKTIGIVASLLLASAAFAAGNGGGSKPVIRFAFSWQNGFEETMKDYSSKVKDKYTLELEHTSGLDHKQKIQVDVSGGNTPDVFGYWSYETNLGDMARGGVIQDVDAYFAASKKIARKDFSDGAWSAARIDDKYYAIPYESFKGYFAVNKALLDSCGLSAPKTWDDIRKMTPVLRAKGIIPLAMGSLRGDAGHLFFSALTYQTKTGYRDTMDMKRTNNFKYAGTAKATDAVLDLVRWKAVPEDTISSGGWDAQLALYNSKKAAMIFTFPWVLANFDPAIAAQTVIIPVPRIPGGEVDPASFTVGGIAQSVCINKASWNDPAKRAAIIDLLDYILSDDMFALRAKQEGNFPAKKATIPTMESAMFNKVVAFTAKQDIYGIHEFFFNSLEAYDAYKSANDQLWAGALTRDEFLNNVQKALDATK